MIKKLYFGIYTVYRLHTQAFSKNDYFMLQTDTPIFFYLYKQQFSRDGNDVNAVHFVAFTRLSREERSVCGAIGY